MNERKACNHVHVYVQTEQRHASCLHVHMMNPCNFKVKQSSSRSSLDAKGPHLTGDAEQRLPSEMLPDKMQWSMWLNARCCGLHTQIEGMRGLVSGIAVDVYRCVSLLFQAKGFSTCLRAAHAHHSGVLWEALA